MTQCRPIRLDAAALSGYARLFADCYPRSAKFTPQYLRWLYCQNPEGPAIGFDAWDGDRLAGHYVGVPARVRVQGRELRALLSLNTATHPDYRGQGLFIRLAQMGYEAAATSGFEAVFGVANANSTHGFVRKLGFQLVQPLQASVGIGGLAVDWDLALRKAQFVRAWSAQSLAWRCANPANPVFMRRRGHSWQCHAAAQGLWLPAYGELPLTEQHEGADAPSGALSPLRLFIGLLPQGATRLRRYAPIPHSLRSSPLNFIWRPLSQRVGALESGSVNFSFLDFDAY